MGRRGTRPRHDIGWQSITRTPDNPHIHVLVRGRADGKDLVGIARDYIHQLPPPRERVTPELGPRSEREITP